MLQPVRVYSLTNIRGGTRMATATTETPSAESLPNKEAVAEAEDDPKPAKLEQNAGSSQRGATEKTSAKNSIQSEDEGVEVVLGVQGPDQVVDSGSPPRQTPDQNVFRGPHYDSNSRSSHYASGGYPPRARNSVSYPGARSE